MADHSQPTNSTGYSVVLTSLKDRMNDLARMFNPSSTAASNIPTNAIRMNDSNNRFEKWSGTAWSALGRLLPTDNSQAQDALGLSAVGKSVAVATTTQEARAAIGADYANNCGDDGRPGAARGADGAAELRGRAVVVTIFSTDCPYCLRHNRRLDRLARATREQPLTVLAAALDRDRSPVEAYLAREGHGFAVTMDGPALREVLTARQVKPITAIIDRRGVLRELIPGEMAEDDVMGLAKWAQG